MNRTPSGARWLWQSLSSRLLLTYLILVTLSVGGLILWSGTRLQAATFEQESHNLATQAQLIAGAMRQAFGESDHENGMPSSLKALVAAYAEEANTSGSLTHARVTVVDRRLGVLISTEPKVNPGREDNHPEFIAARAEAPQADIRQDEFTGEERIFVAAPVRGEDSVSAYVQLSVSTAPLYESIRQMWLALLGVGGVMLLATAGVSLLLARGIARPVQTLTRASEAIAQGDLDRRVTPGGPDEIARLGHAFNRMTDRLQDLITRQQEFAGNAAHELRTPLTGLRLRLELLQDRAAREPLAARDDLRQMEHEVTHLQRVVEQLLALAALDQGAPATHRILDLAPLLYELTDQLSPLVSRAGVQLTVNVPPHLPPVDVNPEQIRMALRNLLDNAIKYTPTGGCVTLCAESHPDALEIAVVDTGEGIPAEALPHIFDRFYRVNQARDKRVRGSGLGLTLARSMIQANRGSIQVTSMAQRGSTFTIRLPLAQVEAIPRLSR